jgi:uncharacterized short protein YbdD (DUF466 family)
MLSLWRQIRSTLVRLSGMPDYERYLLHCRAQHPELPVLSESEFFQEYLERRATAGPSRCC